MPALARTDVINKLNRGQPLMYAALVASGTAVVLGMVPHKVSDVWFKLGQSGHSDPARDDQGSSPDLRLINAGTIELPATGPVFAAPAPVEPSVQAPAGPEALSPDSPALRPQLHAAFAITAPRAQAELYPFWSAKLTEGRVTSKPARPVTAATVRKPSSATRNAADQLAVAAPERPALPRDPGPIGQRATALESAFAPYAIASAAVRDPEPAAPAFSAEPATRTVNESPAAAPARATDAPSAAEIAPVQPLPSLQPLALSQPLASADNVISAGRHVPTEQAISSSRRSNDVASCGGASGQCEQPEDNLAPQTVTSTALYDLALTAARVRTGGAWSTSLMAGALGHDKSSPNLADGHVGAGVSGY